MDTLEEALDALGELIGQELKPNAKGTCTIAGQTTGVRIHIEKVRNPLRLLIASELGKLPQGNKRILFYQEALKWNGVDHPPTGVFAYSDIQQALVLVHYIPMDDLKVNDLNRELIKFEKKAAVWADAITMGYPPPMPGEKAAPSGMMGLMP